MLHLSDNSACGLVVKRNNYILDKICILFVASFPQVAAKVPNHERNKFWLWYYSYVA